MLSQIHDSESIYFWKSKVGFRKNRVLVPNTSDTLTVNILLSYIYFSLHFQVFVLETGISWVKVKVAIESCKHTVLLLLLPAYIMLRTFFHCYICFVWGSLKWKVLALHWGIIPSGAQLTHWDARTTESTVCKTSALTFCIILNYDKTSIF